MEAQFEAHKCGTCGKECLLMLISIGTLHQWVEQVICPDCITPEHLHRVGRKEQFKVGRIDTSPSVDFSGS